MSQRPPDKREMVLSLLERSDSVYVNFDPRIQGVVLPPHLRRSARLVLQYGMNMPIPIPDLDVGVEGIGATLSFERRPVWTFVPWTAVFAVVTADQQVVVWEDDIPPDVPVEGKAKSTPSKKPERPRLHAVGAEPAKIETKPDPQPEREPPTPSPPKEDTGGKKKRELPPYLRVVK